MLDLIDHAANAIVVFVSPGFPDSSQTQSQHDFSLILRLGNPASTLLYDDLSHDTLAINTRQSNGYWAVGVGDASSVVTFTPFRGR